MLSGSSSPTSSIAAALLTNRRHRHSPLARLQLAHPRRTARPPPSSSSSTSSSLASSSSSQNFIYSDHRGQHRPPPICTETVFESFSASLLKMAYKLCAAPCAPVVDVQKGKQVVDYVQSCTITRHSSDGRSPSADRVKLNVDGSFRPDGSAGTGMAVRDNAGSSIFVACRHLFGCADVVDAAELVAMEEGLALALHWSPLPVPVEMDCAESVVLVQSSCSEYP
ncbi:Sec14 cytosolic factor [Hordeum vulgare]|nr:Sec14 cytosolic factor [Hordeum vulgare]